MPEGQEIPSNANQLQGYPNFGKQHNYLDKLRQNSPNVMAGLNPNVQNMIPNLQNLNPNMQSSPNLTHTGSNAPNLSLNFQNLSPIANPQGPAQSPGTPQLADSEFQRLNPQMTTMSGQYNGNVQVSEFRLSYVCNLKCYEKPSTYDRFASCIQIGNTESSSRDQQVAQNALLHKLQPKISPVGSIASQRPLSQLSSHNANKYTQGYSMQENSSALHAHMKKPIETSQSMHNLSKPNVPSSGSSSIPDQNQNMKTALSSGNLAVGSSSSASSKQTAEQRLTHEQFRAALQMVVREENLKSISYSYKIAVKYMRCFEQCADCV